MIDARRWRRPSTTTACIVFLSLSIGVIIGAAHAQQPASPTPFIAQLTVAEGGCLPLVLAIPADTEVTIELVNDTARLQNVRVPVLDISATVEPGDSSTIAFSAAAGSYAVACAAPDATPTGSEAELAVTHPETFNEPPASPLAMPSGVSTPSPNG
jgi:hypothetical protein